MPAHGAGVPAEFDWRWYVIQYADECNLKATKQAAEGHYAEFGRKEGKACNEAQFNGAGGESASAAGAPASP